MYIPSSTTKADKKGLKELLQQIESTIHSHNPFVQDFKMIMEMPEEELAHGKIVISNVCSIFFLTVYLLLVYNFSHLLPHLACKLAGYCGYFFTIAMFSWMTIMSFDLCWTFMRAKVPRKGSALLKFVIYSGVAWGFFKKIHIYHSL